MFPNTDWKGKTTHPVLLAERNESCMSESHSGLDVRAQLSSMDSRERECNFQRAWRPPEGRAPTRCRAARPPLRRRRRRPHLPQRTAAPGSSCAPSSPRAPQPSPAPCSRHARIVDVEPADPFGAGEARHTLSLLLHLAPLNWPTAGHVPVEPSCGGLRTLVPSSVTRHTLC